MKVLIVSNKFPPNAHGGYEASAGVVARTLVAQGHQVTVATSKHSFGAWLAEPTVKVDFTFGELPWYMPSSIGPTPTVPHLTPKQIAQLITGSRAEHNAALARLIEREQPELIWAFNIRRLGPLGVMLTCLSSGVPTLFHLQDHLDSDFIENTVKAAELDALRELKRRAFALFCSRVSEVHNSLIGKFGASRIAPTYGPPASAAAPAFHAYSSSGPLQVVHCGTLCKEKGTDIVVEGFATVAQKYPGRLHLHLIGSGDHILMKKMERPGVEVLGHLEAPAVLEQVAQSHVAILPLRVEEPFGLVALEAVRAGCVSLIGASAGSTEILDPNHNFIPLYTRTAAEIALILENVLLAPENYQALAANARQTTTILTPDLFVKNVLALKDEIPIPAAGALASIRKALGAETSAANSLSVNLSPA